MQNTIKPLEIVNKVAQEKLKGYNWKELTKSSTGCEFFEQLWEAMTEEEQTDFVDTCKDQLSQIANVEVFAARPNWSGKGWYESSEPNSNWSGPFFILRSEQANSAFYLDSFALLLNEGKKLASYKKTIPTQRTKKTIKLAELKQFFSDDYLQRFQLGQKISETWEGTILERNKTLHPTGAKHGIIDAQTERENMQTALNMLRTLQAENAPAQQIKKAEKLVKTYSDRIEAAEASAMEQARLERIIALEAAKTAQNEEVATA
jgi:hypothetical protein